MTFQYKWELHGDHFQKASGSGFDVTLLMNLWVLNRYLQFAGDRNCKPIRCIFKSHKSNRIKGFLRITSQQQLWRIQNLTQKTPSLGPSSTLLEAPERAGKGQIDKILEKSGKSRKMPETTKKDKRGQERKDKSRSGTPPPFESPSFTGP